MLLSFLLAETYLGLYVLALFSMLLLIGGRVFPAKKTVDATVVTLVLLLLAACGLSLLGSISLPLSLYGLIRYVFLFVFFLFFFKTDFSEEEQQVFFHLLLFQGIALAFVSALFFFLPEYGSKIPGMNLIFSTYGHNHLGAIMLILNPIAFWLYLKEKHNFYFFLFVLFSTAMMLSFGRVVIFLGLIQVVILALLYKKWQAPSFKSPFGLMLVGVAGILLVSLAVYIHAGQSGACLVDIEDAAYREQVCKTDLRKNVRHFYWQQGWQAALARPLFGYGLGTFGSISYQYRQIPEFRSSYAHNDYLQLFAEGGVFVGTLFILLLGFLYWGIWRKVSSSQKVLLFVSLASIGVDIFFDFDFHFFGVALLMLLLFALVFESPRRSSSQLAAGRLKAIVTAALVGLVLTTGLYVAVDRLIAAGKEDTAYRIFPFWHWHALNFMKSEKLSLEQKTSLAKAHGASPMVQAYWLDFLEGDAKVTAEYQSWQADPWRKTTSFLPQAYLEKQDAESLEKVLLEISSFLADKRARYGFQRESIAYPLKVQWAKGFLFLADKKFAEKKYAQAGQFVQAAAYFDEWSLAQPSPIFVQTRAAAYQPALRDFLAPLHDIPAEYFGENRDWLSRLYFDQTLDLLQSGENDELMKQSAQRAMAVAEWNVGWFRAEIFSDDLLWAKLVQQSAWDSFYRHALIFHAVRSYQFQNDEYYADGYYRFLTERFLNPLQLYIDAQLERGNEEQPGRLLDTMAQNMSGAYWIQAQRGYFYGLIGQFAKAQTAFEECLAASPEHEDCRHGLQNLIEKGYPDLGRYQEIRQILLAL